MENALLILVYLVFYAAMTVPLYFYGKKANYEKAYYAFIPIANYIMILNIIGMPIKFVILMFIPGVNGVFGLYIFYKLLNLFEKGKYVFIAIVAFMAATILMPYIGFLGLIIYWGHALTTRLCAEVIE